MTTDKFKFYRVSDSYINYLHTLEPKIHQNYPNATKPQVGILLNINEHQYIAPLSSYNTPQKALKYDKIKNKTIFKIWDDSVTPMKSLAVIHINNMYPIIQTEIEWMDFSLEDPGYQIVLNKEYSYIDKHKEAIREQAKELYDAVLKGQSFYKSMSNDFLLLEKEYTNFGKEPVKS